MQAAWLSAHWARVKKMPTFAEVTAQAERKPQKKPTNWQAMYAAATAWAAAAGEIKEKGGDA